jgi:hypothetical protein
MQRTLSGAAESSSTAKPVATVSSPGINRVKPSDDFMLKTYFKISQQQRGAFGTRFPID